MPKLLVTIDRADLAVRSARSFVTNSLLSGCFDGFLRGVRLALHAPALRLPAVNCAVRGWFVDECLLWSAEGTQHLPYVRQLGSDRIAACVAAANSRSEFC